MSLSNIYDENIFDQHLLSVGTAAAELSQFLHRNRLEKKQISAVICGMACLITLSDESQEITLSIKKKIVRFTP